jgi:hypothetical protein
MPTTSDAIKAIQDLVSQWWVGFALSGLLLLVLGWKLNPYWANSVITFAWGILVLSAWRTPLIAHNPAVPRLLLTTLFASVSGLSLYYLLWTVVKDAPLAIRVTTVGKRPEGTTIAGIKWHHNFGELRMVIANPTDMDYQNLNLQIKPDVLVADMAQVTKVDGVSFWRDNIPTTAVEQFNQAGRQAANFEPIAADTGYRVRASVLPAMTNVEFVLVLVSIRVHPPSPPDLSNPDYAIRIGLKNNDTGEESGVWIGNPDHTDALFDKPPTPKEVTVAGKYTSQQIEKKVNLKLPLRDFVGDAAAEILSERRDKK